MSMSDDGTANYPVSAIPALLHAVPRCPLFGIHNFGGLISTSGLEIEAMSRTIRERSEL